MRSALELEVLGSVGDDYEAPHTIASDIARETGRSITEIEVRAVLLALARSGLVQAYAYDAEAARYRPITYDEAVRIHDAWFMSTAAGAEELQRHAS